ncbi:mechanosensitive ion channel family protein [Mariniblastus fucicola]|nr:mechanosensitive ion channel family protein [Mariniblastus fucicola]
MRKSNSTTGYVLLAAFFAVLLLPGVAMAWDAEMAKQLSQGASEHTASIVELVRGAIGGDRPSIDILVQTKLIPAIILLAALVLTWTVASSIGRYVGGMVSKKVDLTLGKFLTKAVRNLLMVVVAIGVLGYFKVDVTSFAAVLAALGFAIGMALQGTLGNFASGIMLLMFRPFKVDDFIVVADTQGTVEEIDLFTTRINTLDNRHIIIPNSEIFGSKLENYTRNELRRVDVNVGAAYSADLDRTRAALERAIEKSDCVAEPCGYVYLIGLGASSVDWQLRAWCKTSDYWAVREQLVANAKKEMDIAGIGIPFPQLDVHVGGKLLAKSA